MGEVLAHKDEHDTVTLALEAPHAVLLLISATQHPSFLTFTFPLCLVTLELCPGLVNQTERAVTPPHLSLSLFQPHCIQQSWLHQLSNSSRDRTFLVQCRHDHPRRAVTTWGHVRTLRISGQAQIKPSFLRLGMRKWTVCSSYLQGQ